MEEKGIKINTSTIKMIAGIVSILVVVLSVFFWWASDRTETQSTQRQLIQRLDKIESEQEKQSDKLHKIELKLGCLDTTMKNISDDLRELKNDNRSVDRWQPEKISQSFATK